MQLPLFTRLGKEMDQNESGSKVTPCYAPYRTVYNTFKRFKESVVPHHVDSTNLSGSGSTISALKKGLLFLGCIQSNGLKTQRLDELVAAAETDQWESVYGKVITESYAHIVNGLNLEAGSAKQLDICFQASGLSGSTKRKAVRFYLESLKAAGIPHSPHFKPPPEPKSKKKPDNGDIQDTAQGEKKENEAATNGAAPPEVSVPPGFTKIDVPIPGRDHPSTLIFPEDITVDEWNFVQLFFKHWHDLHQKKTEKSTPE